MVPRLCLGCKKKLVVFRWTNSNLDRAISKDFWFQVSANIYRQQPQFLYLTYLLTVTVSLTVLYEKEFNSTWILKYSRSITSTMFINNNFLLIMPMIPFRDCMYSNEMTDSDIKKIWQNNWQMLLKEKMKRGINFWRSGWCEEVDKNLTSQLNRGQ